MQGAGEGGGATSPSAPSGHLRHRHERVRYPLPSCAFRRPTPNGCVKSGDELPAGEHYDT
jgi:hypothetical protein